MPIDVELARLGQLQAKAPKADSSFRLQELETRTAYLLSKGFAQEQGQGVGYKTAAWATLRDKEIALALEAQLGIKGRDVSQGISEGVVIGQITTTLGKQNAIDRGVGIALAPAANVQELAIGHVIGAGLER